MISKEELLKVAKLAKLILTDEEASEFSSNLSSILEHVAQLERVDVSRVEPMSHVHGITNVLRADEVTAGLPTEAGLANAPESSGELFRVPLAVE